MPSPLPSKYRHAVATTIGDDQVKTAISSQVRQRHRSNDYSGVYDAGVLESAITVTQQHVDAITPLGGDGQVRQAVAIEIARRY